MENSSGLIGLTNIPLRELWKMDSDGVLDNMMKKILDDQDEAKTVSAFNSAI